MRRIGRRNRGFERCGALSVEALGLPRARARELLLAHAWQRAAGEPMAGRVQVTVRRGVLELEASDPAWHEAIERLLPELALAVVREAPSLGIRSYRLANLSGEPAGKPVSLGALPGQRSPSPALDRR